MWCYESHSHTRSEPDRFELQTAERRVAQGRVLEAIKISQVRKLLAKSDYKDLRNKGDLEV